MSGRNAIVLWQAAQSLVLGMCVAVFGVALKGEPAIWQMPQFLGVPLKSAFRWQDSQGRSRCTPSSSNPVVKWSKGKVIGGVLAAAIVGAGTSIENASASGAIHPKARRSFMCEYLLHPCAFPGIGRMTAVTLLTVLAQMPVILVVAAAALLRRLHRAWRLAMAFGALQFAVSAQQRKMSLFSVIENPQRPAVGRMAALAFLAEPAFVHVVARMAVDASRRCLTEGHGRVALRAADHPVQTQQREFAQVMIEHDAGPPRILSMTGFAAALELAAVRVFAAMAAQAVLGELLGSHGCGVTGVAVHLGVRTGQRKLSFRGMVISDRLPAV